MRFLTNFDKFNSKTISYNNDEYDKYCKSYKNDRSKMVAWVNNNSQEVNYDLCLRYISNGDSLLDYGCGIGDFSRYLESKNITLDDYLGVDINPNFIKIASDTYPDKNFRLINSISDVKGKFDVVCAIGVFTWFITKDDFIEIILNLYKHSNKYLVMTFLYGFDYKLDSFWKSKYRKYHPILFRKLFPNFKMDFHFSNSDPGTFVVKITK